MPDSIPPTPWVNQWSEVRPVTLIGKRRAYFEIPVFSVTGIEDLGTSFIVGVFNYVAVRNLTLRNLPELPEDVNYIPCIKYRLDDGTVYRFKLWEVEGDEVYYPVYNGELILKNFQIEIWVLPSETSVNNDAVITINNSIVVNRSDNFIPTQSDSVEEPEDEDIVTSLDNTNSVEDEPEPATGRMFDYDADVGVTEAGGLVSLWESSVGGFSLNQPTGAEQPSIVGPDAAINNHNYILFDGVNDTLIENLVTTPKHFFFVLRQVSWTNGEVILSTSNNFKLIQSGTTPNLRATAGSTDTAEVDNDFAALNTWCIVEIFGEEDELLTLRITVISDGTYAEIVSTDVASYSDAIDITLGFANVRIAKMIGYGNVLEEEDREKTIQYLKHRYSADYADQIGIPLTYSNSQHGVANS